MHLSQAFWGYAVLLGLAVNLATSGLFFFFLAADWPVLAIIAGYGISVPYDVVATVGVWRAAGCYEGDRAHAEVARVVTVVGMLLLSLT